MQSSVVPSNVVGVSRDSGEGNMKRLGEEIGRDRFQSQLSLLFYVGNSNVRNVGLGNLRPGFWSLF